MVTLHKWFMYNAQNTNRNLKEQIVFLTYLMTAICVQSLQSLNMFVWILVIQIRYKDENSPIVLFSGFASIKYITTLWCDVYSLILSNNDCKIGKRRSYGVDPIVVINTSKFTCHYARERWLHALNLKIRLKTISSVISTSISAYVVVHIVQINTKKSVNLQWQPLCVLCLLPHVTHRCLCFRFGMLIIWWVALRTICSTKLLNKH